LQVLLRFLGFRSGEVDVTAILGAAAIDD